MRLALAGAFAVALVAVALVVLEAGGSDTSAAFAVEPQPGGGSTIKIYSPEDAAGLEAALSEFGIDSQIDWLPPGTGCREPYFESSSVKTASGESLSSRGGAGPIEAKSVMEIEILTRRQWEALKAAAARGEEPAVAYLASDPNITLDPESFGPGQSVVISGFRGPYGGDPEGGFEFHFDIATGKVGACEPVALPGGGLLGAMNRHASSGQTSDLRGHGPA